MRRILFALFFAFFAVVVSAQAPMDSTQVVTPGRANDPKQEQKPYVIFISADVTDKV